MNYLTKSLNRADKTKRKIRPSDIRCVFFCVWDSNNNNLESAPYNHVNVCDLYDARNKGGWARLVVRGRWKRKYTSAPQGILSHWGSHSVGDILSFVLYLATCPTFVLLLVLVDVVAGWAGPVLEELFSQARSDVWPVKSRTRTTW